MLLGLTGFFISLAFTLKLILLAPRIGFIDHPDQRKHHDAPTPLVGGVAMYLSLVCSYLLMPGQASIPFAVILLSTAVVALGAVDDRFGLQALPRLVAQVFIALAMSYWGGVELSSLGKLNFSDDFALGYFAVPLTIIATVGVINAVNFIDGLDGLAAGLSLVTLCFLLLMANAAGSAVVASQLLLLVGVVLGFLVFNARFFRNKPAATFMGDAGSMFLGLVIAWYLISQSQGDGRIISPVTALWIFALPLFDTVGMMLRRIIKGRSPFSADREHVHHIFILAGFSVNQTVSVILAIAVVLGLVGVSGELLGINEGVMFWLFLGTFGLYFFVMMHAWKTMRWIKAHMG